MEINGLPLHALAIHGAVVFGPLAALLAVAYVASSRWRAGLRLPMAGLALVAGFFVVLAYLSGDSYLDSNPALSQLPAVATHQERAGVTLWVTIAFVVVAVTTAALHRRSGAVRVVLVALLAATALATLVSVVLTGEAGTRAAWG